MVEQFAGPGKLFACVSDSYDIYRAAGELWPSLRNRLVEKGGTLVVRPDSGDPIETPIEVIKILMEQFGYSTNSKGFKVLDPCVRVIQGDGIDHTSLQRILDRMIEEKLSIDNIAFGMGGGLLQKVDRDTLKYAMKASARGDTAGVWHDVYKDPITDSGKTSKRGRLGLIQACGLGNCGFQTVPKEIADEKGNVLRTVYLNGDLLVDEDFEKVRQRAQIVEEEYMPQTIERY